MVVMFAAKPGVQNTNKTKNNYDILRKTRNTGTGLRTTNK